MKKIIRVREARTLDLRIALQSYETYAQANCATTPLLMWALRYTLNYLDFKENDEKIIWGERGSNSRPQDHSTKL